MSALPRRTSVWILLTALAACAPLGQLLPSGLGGDPNDPQALLDYLEVTNLDSRRFPWQDGVADGQLKRWYLDRDGPIPVQLNGSTLAEGAIATIEATLQMSLFDTASLVGVDPADVVRGIIVSEGTAVGPQGAVTRSTCGTVSAGPNATDYPPDFYDDRGAISTRLYVNLSSAQCTASPEIAVHEFGHALGLGSHFPGFGWGQAIGPAFWNVLLTLYSSEVGSARDRIEVQLLDPAAP